jgi:uncharacterized RDD family membrane protein YckC/type II secretory pathway pseudopilin PulG
MGYASPMDNEPVSPAAPAPAAAPLDAAGEYSAGFWLRAGAYMIDGVIVAIGSVVLNLILPSIVSAIARLLLSAAYFTAMPVRNNGQTLGKMAAGVAIVRDDGTPLSYGRAFARWLGYLVSGVTLCLGFICAAFTPRKRALHDYIADTRVVRVEELSLGRKIAVIGLGLLFPLLVVLGILAAIMIPKFTNLQTRAGEGATKGRLGMLRSALAIYYGDTEGNYPPNLDALVPKYVQAVEPPGLPNQPAAAGVEQYGAEVCGGPKGADIDPAKLRNTGKWGYVVAPKAPCDGSVFVDSTQSDTKGTPWYTY